MQVFGVGGILAIKILAQAEKAPGNKQRTDRNGCGVKNPGKLLGKVEFAVGEIKQQQHSCNNAEYGKNKAKDRKAFTS